MIDEEPKRFFDVQRPGRSAADATSKPIIVGNRPVIKDPMMRTKDTPLAVESTMDDDTPENQTKLQNQPSAHEASVMPQLRTTASAFSSSAQADMIVDKLSSNQTTKNVTDKVIINPPHFSKPSRGRKLLLGLGLLMLFVVVVAIAFILSGNILK